MNSFDRTSPVVMGGIGGSGTRVVAQLCKGLGIYLGNYLSAALDNLWYTAFFKRNDLFLLPEKEKKAEITEGLSIMTHAMIGEASTSDTLRQRIADYVQRLDFQAYFANEGEEYFTTIPHLITMLVSSQKPDSNAYKGWGWKEPNSHILLDRLVHYYSGLKYIHIIRHGLDMAFSPNQIQVEFWGNLFGLHSAEQACAPAAAFRYWVKANKRAIHLGKKLLSERFLLLKFEDICNDPMKQIKRLSDFLLMSPAPGELDSLAKIPFPPKSIGRYKINNTSWVTQNDRQALTFFGYDYD